MIGGADSWESCSTSSRNWGHYLNPNMKYTCVLLAIAASATAHPGGYKPKPQIKPDADGRYTLTAPGIRAQFIPYGATLTNLFVKGI